MPVLNNPNLDDPIEAALQNFLSVEKPEILNSSNVPDPPGTIKSKTEKILDKAGLTKERVVQGFVEIIEGSQSEAMRMRALESAAKMHGMLDDNKQGVTIQILNANGAELSSMLGAKIKDA